MKRLLAALVLATALSACGGSSSPPHAASAPAQASGINFTAFTEKLLQLQSDSALPLAVSDGEFVFPDDDNPQAFAGVLPTQ
jgi:hypothetical protein